MSEPLSVVCALFLFVSTGSGLDPKLREQSSVSLARIYYSYAACRMSVVYSVSLIGNQHKGI